jgi:hypothetical protein
VGNIYNGDGITTDGDIDCGGNLKLNANILDSADNQSYILKKGIGAGSYSMGANIDMLVIGNNAGANISTGRLSVIIGNDAVGNGVFSEFALTAVGHGAGQFLNGSNNTVVGYYSGRNTVGGNNVFVGSLAGQNVTASSGNVFIGVDAANSIINGGGGSVCIGGLADLFPTGDNQIAIGYQATTTAANQCIIGNPTLTEISNAGNGVCDLGAPTRKFKDIYTAGDLNIGGDISVVGVYGIVPAATTPNDANGVYSASTTFDVNFPWQVFDQNDATDWKSGVGTYPTGGGSYAGAESTTVDAVPQLGEWVQIGFKGILETDRVDMNAPTAKAPLSWVLAGSLDNITWFSLRDETNVQIIPTLTTFNFTSTKTKYIRLIIRSTNTNPTVSTAIMTGINVYGTRITEITTESVDAPLIYGDAGSAWGFYEDNGANYSLTINAVTTATLPNNALSSITDISQLPSNGYNFYDSSANKFVPELVGDSYTLGIRITASSSSVTGSAELRLNIGAGTIILNLGVINFPKGSGVSTNFDRTTSVFTLATFVANGAVVELTSLVGDTTITSVGFHIVRTHRAR